MAGLGKSFLVYGAPSLRACLKSNKKNYTLQANACGEAPLVTICVGFGPLHPGLSQSGNNVVH